MSERQHTQPHQDVLVVAEVDGGRLSTLTLESLGIGARLAGDLGEKLRLVYLGPDVPPALEGAHCYGVDNVHAAIDPLLGAYQPDLYLQAMQQVVAHIRSRVILFGQTDLGSDLAPRLAFRLRTGVTLDCIDLAIDARTGRLRQTKPVFGGKAVATYVGDALPQIVSVRQGSFAAATRTGAEPRTTGAAAPAQGPAQGAGPAPQTASATDAVLPIDLTLDPTRARTRLVEKVQDETLALGLDLASASVVVSGGRGIRDHNGVELLSETAALLGGSIGATRAAVDDGLLPRSVLVGLTGRRINPRLYMAVGISGSLHHMAGCMRSRTIVAINSDDSAPIFAFSHVGVVGDLREVLAGFNDEIAKLTGAG